MVNSEQVLKLKEQLCEVEREMQSLLEMSNGVSSNSPSSSFSMEAVEPLFLGGFGMEGLDNVFGLEWPINPYGM